MAVLTAAIKQEFRSKSRHQDESKGRRALSGIIATHLLLLNKNSKQIQVC